MIQIDPTPEGWLQNYPSPKSLKLVKTLEIKESPFKGLEVRQLTLQQIQDCLKTIGLSKTRKLENLKTLKIEDSKD